MRPTTLYDASVLYPSLIRNLLMHLATQGLVAARWTDAIHEEWMRNLLEDQPYLTAERLQRTRQFMEQAVPDATVTDYESLVADLSLPDPDDRHVLAAAITSGADVIVTQNLRHFPTEALQPHGLKALTPDELMCQLLEQKPKATVAAFEALRLSLRKPPYSWPALVERLRQVGLEQTAILLAN